MKNHKKVRMAGKQCWWSTIIVLLRSSKPTAGRHPFVAFSLLSISQASAPSARPSSSATPCRDVHRVWADRHQNHANHGDVVGGGLISHAWSQASLKGERHQNNSDQSLHRQRLLCEKLRCWNCFKLFLTFSWSTLCDGCASGLFPLFYVRVTLGEAEL